MQQGACPTVPIRQGLPLCSVIANEGARDDCDVKVQLPATQSSFPKQKKSCLCAILSCALAAHTVRLRDQSPGLFTLVHRLDETMSSRRRQC